MGRQKASDYTVLSECGKEDSGLYTTGGVAHVYQLQQYCLPAFSIQKCMVCLVWKSFSAVAVVGNNQL